MTESPEIPDQQLPPDPEEVLVPKLDDRFAVSRGQFLLLIGICLFFMYYNYMRIFHTDFWGHVAYGNWIIENEKLPEQELFVPLAEGVPVVATAWGAQVILGAISRLGDVELFSHLWAVSVLTMWLVFARAFYLQTRNGPVAMLAALLGWFVWWSRHAVIRPEIFGSICFAILVLMMVKSDSARTRKPDEIEPNPLTLGRSITLYFGVALLFALWANLHGSFIVGFGVIGAYILGRATELLSRKLDVQTLFADGVFRQRVIIAQAAVLGALLNPYGMDLFVHTLVFPSNPNLKDIWEWYPLKAVSLEGPFVAFSWGLFAVLMRHSKRRVAATDVWLFVIFSLAVCLRVRMIQWYAPIVMLVLAPHLANCIERIIARLEQGSGRETLEWLRVKSFRLSLFAGLLLWATFCFSPVSRIALGGNPRKARQVFSADTPRGITEYLRKHPPKGLVATPQWWGDWIAWDGPQDIEVLMTTNAVHVAPQTVWKDYLAIAEGQEGLSRRLDRYRINTVVVCKSLQQRLLRQVRELNGWVVSYEDERGVVAFRKTVAPLPEPKEADAVASVTGQKKASTKPSK